MHNKLAICFVGFTQRTAKLAQKPRILSRTAPNPFIRGLLPEQIWQYGRLFSIVEELVHWHFESTRQLFQRFDGGNGVTILDAGNVTSEQASALFNVALGELLFFAQHAKTFTYYHGRIRPPTQNRWIEIHSSLHVSLHSFHLVESCRPSRIDLVRSHKHQAGRPLSDFITIAQNIKGPVVFCGLSSGFIEKS